MLKELLDYGPVTFTTGIALFYLKKDWPSFNKSWQRWSVFFLVVILWSIGISSTHTSNKNNAEDLLKKENERHQDKKQIASLQSSVETSNKNQEANTKLFVEYFSSMSLKISYLQSKVDNEELRKYAANLQKELASTQKELTLTQKALVKPIASLTFTFPKNSIDDPPVHTITLPVKNDIVQVPFRIKNNTEVTAENIEVTLSIGDRCRFNKESEHFRKITGQAETQRTLKVPRMFARTESEDFTIDVKVPPNLYGMAFGITYRCSNCDVPKAGGHIGSIFFSRNKD